MKRFNLQRLRATLPPGRTPTAQALHLLSPNKQRVKKCASKHCGDPVPLGLKRFVNVLREIYPNQSQNLKFAQILDWLQDQSVLDFGPHPLLEQGHLPYAEFLNKFGVEDAVAIESDAESKNSRKSVNSRWPVEDKSRRLIVSYLVPYDLDKSKTALIDLLHFRHRKLQGQTSEGPPTDYEHIASEIKRTLRDDGMAVLDAVGAEKAHVIGASMGGN